MPENALDAFGRIISQHLRDPAIDYVDGLIAGHWKAPALQPLQQAVSNLATDQQQVMRRVVIAAIDAAVHDFLFHLQQQRDFDDNIRLLANDVDVVDESDGLQGEVFGDDGWFARFSAFGAPPEEP